MVKQLLRKFAGRTQMEEGQIGRIIQDEGEETVNVEISSYARLIKMGGGFCILFILQLVMCLFVFSQIAGDFMTQKWAKSD